MKGMWFIESEAFLAASWERKRIQQLLGQDFLLFWINQHQVNNWKKIGTDKIIIL